MFRLKTLAPRSLSWQLILLCGLSVSIGWGIRGQFGHEYGAALAGALGGMVVALLSGREDWQRRIPYFALFGALGMAFGGGMSYMKNVAYVHSTDSTTVLYGFGTLFLLGFIWAAPAGAGIALPVYLNREELTKTFVPLSAVLIAWYLQDATRVWYGGFSAEWAGFIAGQAMSAILAILAVLVVVLVRRKYWGAGTSLILHMAAGWCAGHLFLIEMLHLDLNPPRGDSWAGYLGMVGGILVFCWRNQFGGIGFATVGVGLLGGIGFALGAAVKLSVMASGFTTNWHSVMEQTQGFFLGVAIAIGIGLVIHRAPEMSDELRVGRWTEVFSATFVLVLFTYLNFRRGPGEWTKEISTLTPELYGINIAADFLPARGFIGWIEMIYIAIAFAMILLLVTHLQRPLAFLPQSWLGKGQLFYLVFLWWIVTINFAHVLPRFTPVRLVTEWFMTLNAVACTVLLLLAPAHPTVYPAVANEDGPYFSWNRNVALLGIAGTIVVCFVGLGAKLLFWGTGNVGIVNSDQIRFGPGNTNTIK
ncbi:MAG: hypothetical protein JWO80_387 [Bryobacterales bacterium]|nr:hypothetical protein [Bryobacterales bacterium]